MRPVILFLGPPGAGKGTHAFFLSEELGIPHISTGELFREHIRNATKLGGEAKKYINRGCLVPDRLVLAMLLDRVAQEDCSRGYILDGFPRTVAQAEALGGQGRLIPFYFEVPDEILVERIAGRLACQGCSRCYHRTFAPPKQQGQCDGCKGVLYVREDDGEEVLRQRLHVYRSQTAPVIDFYEGGLFRIDGARSKEEIVQEILSCFRRAEAEASAASI